MKIIDIINNIDNGSLALPVFQRGYVWKRSQVKDLMNSLYQEYPVGSLLTWTTRVGQVDTKGDQLQQTGPIDLLLDGQQRLTSLYGVIKGKPPVFFDGNSRAFEGLYFNLDSEDFEFYSQAKMRNNPLWVKVTDIFDSSGYTGLIGRLANNPDEYGQKLGAYLANATKVQNIQQTDLYISEITGDDKTTDIVVDIFNRINSGGTKLSKGDLTLARIGAHWPEARNAMQQRTSKWQSAGFDANLDWLLRCMNAIITESSEFERLEPEKAGVEAIQSGLRKAEGAVDRLLEAMRSHLFMDHDRLFNSKQAFSVMVKYLSDCGGSFPDQATMARLFHWYVSVAIWGRFSGQSETVINQDLGALSQQDPITGLLTNLRVSQGERIVTHENFNMSYTNARFYPLLYIMTRVQDGRDWGTGNQLRHHSLGSHTNLEMHHIFPKAYLQKNKVSSRDINNMGNIAFQTRETNQAIGAKPPVKYMPEAAANWPGALESQWIPMEPELWKGENYHRFLEARQRLLAEAANKMLDTLKQGNIPPASTPPVAIQQVTDLPVLNVSVFDPNDEESLLDSINLFIREHGLPSGLRAYELLGKSGEEPVAVLDLAWPDGLQVGLSQPVAMMINEDPGDVKAASDLGFRVFSTVERFQRYVEEEILE